MALLQHNGSRLIIFMPPIQGTIGHVAHGKSTVVKAISGVQVIWEAFIPALLKKIMSPLTLKICFSIDCTFQE